MEYSLDSLVDLIRKNLYDRFPYDPNSKSENIRDIAFYNNPISRFDFGEEPFITFEIGNETAERIAPYYHILQDAQYIRKAGYGTKKQEEVKQRLKILENVIMVEFLLMAKHILKSIKKHSWC